MKRPKLLAKVPAPLATHNSQGGSHSSGAGGGGGGRGGMGGESGEAGGDGGLDGVVGITSRQLPSTPPYVSQ